MWNKLCEIEDFEDPAIAGVIHFIWIQKSDISEPLNWAIWLGVLFAIRVYFAVVKRQRSAATPARAVTPSNS